MNLNEIITSTYTCRYYEKTDIEPRILEEVLDAARWGPSGGNRQPVSLIVIRKQKTKKAIQNLYLPLWEPYAKSVKNGGVKVDATSSSMLQSADFFARNLSDIPVFLVVCVKLADVHPTDTKLDRLSIVGGASVYPAIQNLLLMARAKGLGSALTTLLCAVEPQVKELLGIPSDISTAALITLGHPKNSFPKKLNRKPLAKILWSETFGKKWDSL